jgi:hypothetical protein
MRTVLKLDEVTPEGQFSFALRVYEPGSWVKYHVATLWADRVNVSFQPPYYIVTLFMFGNVTFIAVVDELDLSSAPPELREKFQGARVDVIAEEAYETG